MLARTGTVCVGLLSFFAVASTSSWRIRLLLCRRGGGWVVVRFSRRTSVPCAIPFWCAPVFVAEETKRNDATRERADWFSSTYVFNKQVPIAHAEEVEQVFDAISYCKGACVVKMLNAVLGMDMFKKGLQVRAARPRDREGGGRGEDKGEFITFFRESSCKI